MDGSWTAVAGLVALALFLYYLATRNYDYWKRRRVPYPAPLPFFGNYAQYILQRKFVTEISQALCRQFPNEPYFGTFFGTQPALMVQDPEVIKQVLTKDFYYFNSRELMDYTEREILTKNFFFNFGDIWKNARQGVTPLFSSAKLKAMFNLIKNCANTFEEMLDYETGISDTFDAKTLMTRYTMDCICSCSFGIDVKTMGKQPENNMFMKIGQLIFSKSILRGYAIVCRAMWPKFFYGIGLQAFPPQIDEFFSSVLTDVFKSRDYEPTSRNDFVDLLLALKKEKRIVGDSMSNMKTGSSKKVEIELSDEFLISQCILFFGAGFETSANALSLTLFELAKNQKAQSRAQAEVDEFLKRHNNEIVYDCVTELPFLEACVSETLRLYPVLPVLTREVVEDYQFPSGLHLDRGTRVHIPVYHLHRHAAYFPDPESYKPERFLPDAEHPIRPYTFMPFGEGPRTCIGMRFSKMQVMPGLITFLKKFSVSLAPGTPEKFRHNCTTIVLQPSTDLLLRVSPRDGWESRLFTR